MGNLTRGACALALLALLMAAPGCGGCGSDDTSGEPDASGADASEPDADQVDAGPPDADATPIMSITSIFPEAASRRVTTDLLISGFNLAPGATLVLSNCDTPTTYDLSASVAVAGDGRSMTAVLDALVPITNREQGLYTVTVTNPDGMFDELLCRFRILDALPPVVTDVVPPTAYRGVAGDGVNSDTSVTISGTGFVSTPSVRWVKTDGTRSYEALFVGFTSDVQLTAITPSETLAMVAGDYHVFVTNPDLLSGQWEVSDGLGGTIPGIFTITSSPPPDIVDVDPSRIPLQACNDPITVTGGNFAAGATLWYVAPTGTSCAGAIVDANGATLCPMVVDSIDVTGNTIVGHFDPCPSQGPYPISVINPDGQADYYFSVEITPSSDGHLNTGAFTVASNRLVVPRWKHGAAFGFDAFGGSHVYVVGGQNVNGVVLASVESSQFDLYGTPGPFALAQQYLSTGTPRALNTLTQDRQGLTVVRLGRDLYAAGGAATSTDTTASVAALATVERARILSYEEVPALSLPAVIAPVGLPQGSWYYQVSAIGPWGESLPAREVVAINRAGTLEVCWTPPAAAGATSYNVYRSLASDGRAGTAVAIAYEVAGPCFTDDGVELRTPAPGRARGVVAAAGALAAGDHTYRVSSVVSLIGGGIFESAAGYATTTTLLAADLTAGNASVQVTWDAVGTATYRLYKWHPGSQSYRRLDTGGDLAAPTFIDGGAAFADPVVNPAPQVRPLPPGSLSLWDDTAVPAMTSPREGLDGVAIRMDPSTSAGQVGRILVAGGRTASAAAGTYLTSAESIGIYDDGTIDAAWSLETPQFVSPRAYYALLTTQGREDTPFPPPPEEPPCGDLDNDGFVSCDCAPAGADPSTLDCNDSDPGVNPDATEVCGDGVDQDCDQGCTGTDLPCSCTTDVDDDQHLAPSCGGDDCCDTGTEAAPCTGPAGSCTSTSCTPANAPGIHPGTTDACGDGIDQDCDGIDPPCVCQDDTDGDGHVSIACGGDDCCDVGTDTSIGCTGPTAPGIHPGAAEACNTGVDSNCDGAIAVCFEQASRLLEPTATASARSGATRPPGVIRNVIGNEPIYLVAVAGDNNFVATNNQGRNDFEACLVDAITGRLSCGATWTVQGENDPQSTLGADALLYFQYMYGFYGVNRETTTAGGATRTFLSSAIGRFPLLDLITVVAGQIFDNRQSASTSFVHDRSYYQMLRLLSFVYVVGGWAEARTEGGVAMPDGPTGTIERHQQ